MQISMQKGNNRSIRKIKNKTEKNSKILNFVYNQKAENQKQMSKLVPKIG